MKDEKQIGEKIRDHCESGFYFCC